LPVQWFLHVWCLWIFLLSYSCFPFLIKNPGIFPSYFDTICRLFFSLPESIGRESRSAGWRAIRFSGVFPTRVIGFPVFLGLIA
jgi:hypothetical protein